MGHAHREEFQGCLWTAIVCLLSATTACSATPLDHAYFAIGINGPSPMVLAQGSQPPQKTAATDSSGGGGTSASVATPSFGGGGSSGGGGAAPPPPGVTSTIVTAGLFNILLAAGDSQGGAGLGSSASTVQFRQVAGIVESPDGTLFVSDPINNQIRMVPPTGTPSIACGDANGAAGFLGDNLPAVGARLDGPVGLARDDRTDVIYVCDASNHRLRFFVPGGRIYTLAGGGSDGSDDVFAAQNASLGEIFAVTLDANQNVYFTERDTGRVRRVDPNGHLTTLATLDPGQVGPIVASATGDRLWVGDGGAIRLLLPNSSPVLQSASVVSATGMLVTGLAFDQVSTLYFARTSAIGNGNNGTVLDSLTVAPSGLATTGGVPEVIAGTGGQSASDQDYALPTVPVPDARSQLLCGGGYCSLFIDFYQAGNPNVLSGILYAGNSFVDASGVPRWGQVARLSPTL